eukprot:GFKZ01003805.1.p1 GENE.GFKZ01003805.1~~GFKZ01003805.1.p1  ORF type:complete len:177 (+),score=9.50 GFKZ01003805.1:179-709(+)
MVSLSDSATLAFALPFASTIPYRRPGKCISRPTPPARTPRMHAVPAPPSPPPESTEEDIHPSWRVYSKPGNLCVLCAGEGHVKCLYCYGEGVVRIGPEDARDTIECPQCKGTGYETCIRCDGTGIRPATRYDVLTEKTVRNLTNEEVSAGIRWEDVREERLREAGGNGVSHVEHHE